MALDSLNNLLFFLIAVAVLVSFHEFGHFIVARWMGVRVLRFSVGFGRTVWAWQKNEHSTEYAVGLVPLGGYVKMLDERESDVPPQERELAFNRKSLPRRAFIVAAGPLANILLAIAIYWGIGVLGTQDLDPVVGQVRPGSPASVAGFEAGDRLVALDGRPIRGWSEQRLYLLNRINQTDSLIFDIERKDGRRATLDVALPDRESAAFDPAVLSGVIGLEPMLPVYPPVIGGLVAGGPADRAGILQADTVLEINGDTVADWMELVRTISMNPDRELSLILDRQGARIEIIVVPEAVELDGIAAGRIGVYAPPPPSLEDYFVRVNHGVFSAIWSATETTWLMSAVTVRLFLQMLTGRASKEHLSGPISIARYAGASASLGLAQFLAFLAVLSVSLGILNLLPIPVLDGGHLLYFLFEAVTGKPVPDNVLQWGQQIGIVIIVLLMGLAFYNDLASFFQ